MILPDFARKDFLRLITFSVPASGVYFAVSLFIIGFNLFFLCGLAVGFGLMLLNFYLTALFLSGVSNYKEKAPSRIVTSYILRFLLIALIFTGSVFINICSSVAIALELILPKIIFTVYGILEKGK